MPHALRMKQEANNSNIFLVSFCIGDDYGKFSIKQLAIVKSARSFYHFLWACTFHKILMYISGVYLACSFGAITAYLLKLTDCQLPVDA